MMMRPFSRPLSVLACCLLLILTERHAANASAGPAPNGSPCTAADSINATQCLSTFCSPQGVCCDTSCRGPCRSCNLGESAGTCTFYDAGTDPAGECDDGVACNGQELCDGTGECTRSLHQDAVDDLCQAIADELNGCRIAKCGTESGSCGSVPDPRIGLPCGSSSVGVCQFGTYQCVSNAVTCVGAVLPSTEVEDDVSDNDCDGLIDETTPQDCVSVADCQVPSSNCTSVTCSSGFCLYTVATSGAVCTALGQPCWTRGVCNSLGGCVSDDPATLACSQTYPYPDVSAQCTVGVCNGSGCFSEYFYGPCDDGDPCTVNDACSVSHECTGTPLICDSANPCEDAVCDPDSLSSGPSDVSSYCTYTAKANGTSCLLGSSSNEGGLWSGTCQSGACAETFSPRGCDGVVSSGLVYDACAICGGDNSSCKGCDDVPNSGLVDDACGVCGGDGSSCSGCDGIPNSGLQNDACGVCNGDNSTCKGCDGVVNSGAVNDACGVCDGDGSTCAGCDGIPNSGLAVDACGVCGGDDSSCSDCHGVPNGGAIVDSCGECGGDNSTCAGCDGVPNSGSLIDKCNNCGGDNTTTLGYKAIGANRASCDGYLMYASKFRTTYLGGRTETIRAYFGPNGAESGSQSFQAAIYDTNPATARPRNLVVKSSIAAIDPSSWNEVPISSTWLSPNTTYWIVTMHAADQCDDNNIYYSTSVTGSVTVSSALPGGASELPSAFPTAGLNVTSPMMVSAYAVLECMPKGCDNLYGSGLVVDGCGVCGGNESTCAGCDGIPYSGLENDACGVCGGNGSSCAGCDGVANSGKVSDECGVCGGNDSLCAGCDGVPNSGLALDECQVCGGDNSTCKGCDGVPNSGKAWDACDVCAGNGSTCAGCDGVPNSNKIADACGICGGNGSSCAGCDGVPNSGAVLDACGECDGDNSSCAGCDEIPHSGLVYDACSVCGGDNSSCTGCDGVVNSGKVNDPCGVCGGNGSTCAGCDGVPNSGKTTDACGECGGNNASCAGCDGVANSGKIEDACGVCGGNGTSCDGCDGVPNSGKVNDDCGVCDGDGTSCAGCDGIPNSGLTVDVCGTCGGDIAVLEDCYPAPIVNASTDGTPTEVPANAEMQHASGQWLLLDNSLTMNVLVSERVNITVIAIGLDPTGADEPDGQISIGTYYGIEVFPAGANISIYTFLFHYTQDILSAAGISDPATMSFAYFDVGTSEWVVLYNETTVDTEAQTVSVTVDHLSLWTIFGEEEVTPPTGPPVTTAPPTEAPTEAPTTPVPTTVAPTEAPTAAPTGAPTAAPTAPPTAAPTASPTAAPTAPPTAAPTAPPTAAPTAPPTAAPTVPPTAAPTTVPPTSAPTPAPTTVSPPEQASGTSILTILLVVLPFTAVGLITFGFAVKYSHSNSQHLSNRKLK
jgi:hypothetical protein